MNIEQAWRQAAKQIDSQSCALDAQLLLLHVLEKTQRSYLLTWPDKALTDQQQSAYQHLLQRRINGEPIAHILGQREFWGLPLFVNNSTLIPRSDSETLVEAALAQITQNKMQAGRLLDLGTGTGAIALALKSELPDWQVDAVEQNPTAVELAQRNCQHLKLPINLYQGSWFEPLPANQYAIIVSNPPYIDSNDPHLAQGDVRFEPRSALVAQEQGLADIKWIIQSAVKHLQPSACLLLEHGFEQANAVREIFLQQGYVNVQTTQDLSGQQRVTQGQLKK